MPRDTWVLPGGRKFGTPLSLVTDSAATSPRTEANGVQTCPIGSMICLRQCASADSREYSPGTPRSTQLPGVFSAESAVFELQIPKLLATLVTGSNSGVVRDRLVKFML